MPCSWQTCMRVKSRRPGVNSEATLHYINGNCQRIKSNFRVWTNDPASIL